jgi:pilus assembly protein FimV
VVPENAITMAAWLLLRGDGIQLKSYGGFMTRVHNLLLTLASSSLLYSGVTSALGLGAIALHSGLNQPLAADIELLEVGGLGASDVRVRLASAQDFSRIGVERFFWLNDLRFTPIFNGGRSIIRVTSNKPIREPYVNFVLELTLINGQVLREYTLLIDPPSASAYRSVAAIPAYPQAVVSAAPSARQGQRYRVQAGDSLWRISKRLRGSGSTTSQQALIDGIYALNPEAFIGGDIDRLILGANLLLPDSAITAVAIAEPTSANLATLDAPVEQAPPAALAGQPATTEGAPAALTDPTLSASAQALVMAQQQIDQELAATLAQQRQLQTSMLALEAQVRALQQQLTSKDEQLTLLHASLAETAASSTAAAEAVIADSSATPTAPDSSISVLAWMVGGSGILLGLLGGLALRNRAQRSRRLAAPALRRQADNVPGRTIMQARPAEQVAAVGDVEMAADACVAADIYIAYGRFSEALAILRKSVETEPQRKDLHLHLLKVFAELGDRAAYSEEETMLRQLGVSQGRLDELHSHYIDKVEPQAKPSTEPEVINTPFDAQLNLDEPVKKAG